MFAQPFPGDGNQLNWEICLRDPWGRPGDRIGGLSGPIHSADGALSVFLGTYPEFARFALIAVQTSLADAGPADGSA